MSWDATIAKTSDPNFAKPAEEASLLPMGKPREVQMKLSVAVPSLKWSSTSEGHAYVGQLSLEFSLDGKTEHAAQSSVVRRLGDFDDVESIGVSARGSGDPLSVVVGIAKSYHWSVADAQDGKWIDLNRPSQKSWTEFTKFRDGAAGNLPDGDSPSSGSVAVNLSISIAVLVLVALAIRYCFK